MRNSLVYKK